jgi:hypothetical protein
MARLAGALLLTPQETLGLQRLLPGMGYVISDGGAPFMAFSATMSRRQMVKGRPPASSLRPLPSKAYCRNRPS